MTPGPWSRVIVLGSRFWTLGVIRDHAASPLESDEDWSLAIAAPELYGALKDIIGVIDRRPDRECGVAALDAARAAIAKAEGKP